MKKNVSCSPFHHHWVVCIYECQWVIDVCRHMCVCGVHVPTCRFLLPFLPLNNPIFKSTRDPLFVLFPYVCRSLVVCCVLYYIIMSCVLCLCTMFKCCLCKQIPSPRTIRHYPSTNVPAVSLAWLRVRPCRTHSSAPRAQTGPVESGSGCSSKSNRE